MALALGMGAMAGWKRIVVTVDEKIGKEHLTRAQGVRHSRAPFSAFAKETALVSSQNNSAVLFVHLLL